MYLEISNTPQPYAWGSRTAIAGLQRRPPGDQPEAELWLGTHPGGPSRIDTPGSTWKSLDEVNSLPFLLKLLAADSPLSLQVHPSLDQARRGFARENEAGIALESPERSFKDSMHKPEMVVALSDRFEALAGFRPSEESAGSLEKVAAKGPGLEALRERIASGDLGTTVRWLLEGSARSGAAVHELVEAARVHSGADWETVRELAAAYPRDPGIAVGFLMNRVSLQRGEALFLRAREVHAYLRGFGVELMAASDNVLRAGLTAKHVDVEALLDTAAFTPTTSPRLTPEAEAEGIAVYRPPVAEYALARLDASDLQAHVAFSTAAIALCTRGTAIVNDHVLEQGQAAYLGGDESPISVSGNSELFIAADPGIKATPSNSRRRGIAPPETRGDTR